MGIGTVMDIQYMDIDTDKVLYITVRSRNLAFGFGT